MAALIPKQITVVSCFVVLNLLAIVAIGLRFYSIKVVHRSLKVHDILCVISLVMLIAYSVDLLIATIAGGIGYHITVVPLPTLTIGLKAFFSSQFMWAISIAGFRLSILAFYVQAFTTKIFRYFAYGAMTIVCLFFIGSITTTLTLCRPIASNWDKSIHGKCGDEATAMLAAAAFNMALDIGIVVLPLPVIWGLHMSTQKKAAVMATFTLSLMIAAINLARIVQVKRCPLLDFTYCTADSSILTVAEMAVGIIVACVPMLGPVVFPERRRRFDKRYIYQANQTSYNSYPKHARHGSDSQASTEMALGSNWEKTQKTQYAEIKNKVLPISPANVGDGEIAVWREFEVQSDRGSRV
ncbi:uncharacterized protein N7482_002131 [Penicillium canariense]|uniref:Rhodopsin domain-containing protein n=1 Tax=Penicillium canariense TaxID=189055 RepID=A0A9W9LUJ3_9EURO|nr:uncharacterized protein N7482_002131 [Penicillium canariense]KAJ5176254.1 hypothetical protein N7482_002131 [Penicillium canariense]